MKILLDLTMRGGGGRCCVVIKILKKKLAMSVGMGYTSRQQRNLTRYDYKETHCS